MSAVVDNPLTQKQFRHAMSRPHQIGAAVLKQGGLTHRGRASRPRMLLVNTSRQWDHERHLTKLRVKPLVGDEPETPLFVVELAGVQAVVELAEKSV